MQSSPPPSDSVSSPAPSPVSLTPTLSCLDAIALIVGMVIGVGIFETPALVAQNIHQPQLMLGLWIIGGLLSLVGALCYAELATAYPHPGGNYHYLSRAFGPSLAFLFGWARMTVIQPGSIAMLAFVFADYLNQLWSGGSLANALAAALAVILLTAINLLGVKQGKWAQNWLSLAKVLGLILVVAMGGWASMTSTVPVALTPPPPVENPAAVVNAAANNIGLAMIFVLLSYGGWNEAAYISAEVKNRQRNITRSLLWSIGIISTVYVLVNFAYLKGLGLQGMAQSSAVAADLLRQNLGQPAAWLISLLVAISALGAANATIFTGARTNYALGQDIPLLKALGRWQTQTHTPTVALLVQGGITLALIALGTIKRKGFETMVYYTTPVFWFFFLLSGIALLILRFKEAKHLRPFQVPFYPLTPLIFCLTCGYLLYSSVTYAATQPAGFGVYIGIAVLFAGLPLLLWLPRQPQQP